MFVAHEPKNTLQTTISGVVSGSISKGVVPVELSTGELIRVKAPRQLPSIKGLRVNLEITDYKWTGKRSYTIVSWKSK